MSLPDTSVGRTGPAAGASEGVVMLCRSDVSTLPAVLYSPDAELVDEEGPAVVTEPCQVGL